MKRWPWSLLLLAGCSDISGTGGVVAIEIRLPTPPAVEQHDTLQLVARALDANGRVVQDAVIRWATPDSSISLDSVTGRVTTDTTAGNARVQARVGSLLSDLASLELHPRSDTLLVPGPTTLTVLASDTASDTLRAVVQSLSPDTVGVSNTRILYEVVDTAAAKGKVRFRGDVLALRAATGADGRPLNAVVLAKVPGATPPASVSVRVTATRPSGFAVPGSGQIFTVNFQ
ncbi:MAG TPA: hypothetical protein VG692_11195 [Gemmatimonadales bacterium]|nr:hypothetical protein [Gemmatimonadales bacterium]